MSAIIMSATDLTMAPSAEERSPAPASRVGSAFPWGRVVLACAVLAAAGGIRWAEEQRVNAVLESGHVSPFPLKSLPMELGPWEVSDRRELTLDPEIERETACVDYIKRHYVHKLTGVWVDLLVLYGPATIAHRPEVCYPGSGFVPVDGPRARAFPIPGGKTATFLSLVFAKGEGGAANRQQVFYALRYPSLSDRWTDEIDLKRVARLPGVYKIQLTRRVTEYERLDINNPCESFLEAMLPEMERRILNRPPASTR
jgi:uncharacterized protein DUF3485